MKSGCTKKPFSPLKIHVTSRCMKLLPGAPCDFFSQACKFKREKALLRSSGGHFAPLVPFLHSSAGGKTDNCSSAAKSNCDCMATGTTLSKTVRYGHPLVVNRILKLRERSHIIPEALWTGKASLRLIVRWCRARALMITR